MRSSVNLRPTRWDVLMAAVILLLAAACALGVWRSAPGGALTAVVTAAGQELDRVALDRHSGPEQRVYPVGGHVLTVEFSPEGVAVTESDCPTQDCVRTGRIAQAGRSIVCLPARLSIQLTGGSDDGLDAVIG